MPKWAVLTPADDAGLRGENIIGGSNIGRGVFTTMGQ